MQKLNPSATASPITEDDTKSNIIGLISVDSLLSDPKYFHKGYLTMNRLRRSMRAFKVDYVADTFKVGLGLRLDE